MLMNKLRWAPFLVYKDNKNYAQGYRDDSLQHDDYKKGIHKTAISAEENRKEKKKDSPTSKSRASLKEQNEQQKAEVRRAYNDLVRNSVGANADGTVDIKKLRKKMQFVKHPPLPLPTPSKVRIRTVLSSTYHA